MRSKLCTFSLSFILLLVSLVLTSDATILDDTTNNHPSSRILQQLNYFSITEMQKDFTSTSAKQALIKLYIEGNETRINSTCLVNDPCGSFGQLFDGMENIMEYYSKEIVATNTSWNLLFLVTIKKSLRTESDLALELPSNSLIKYFLMFQGDEVGRRIIFNNSDLFIRNLNDISWIIFYNIELVAMKMVTESNAINYGFASCQLNTISIQHVFNGSSTTLDTTENFMVEYSKIYHSVIRIKGSRLILFRECTFIGNLGNGSEIDLKLSNQVVVTNSIMDKGSLFLLIYEANILHMEGGKFTNSELVVSTISVKKIQITKMYLNSCSPSTVAFSMLFSDSCFVINSIFTNSGGIFFMRGVRAVQFNNVEFSGNTALNAPFPSPISFVIVENLKLVNVSVTNHKSDNTGAYAMLIKDYLFVEIDNCNFSNNEIVALQITNELVVDSTSYTLKIYKTKFINNRCKSNGCAITTKTIFSLTVEECLFQDNRGNSGGAIFGLRLYRSNVKKCVFKNNYSQFGGAISIIDSDLFPNDIMDCDFIGNEATKGGAIYVGESSLQSLSNCTFRMNSATYGGAIYSISPVEKRFSDSRFINNQAVYYPNFMTVLTRTGPLSYGQGNNMVYPGKTLRANIKAYAFDDEIPWFSMLQNSQAVFGKILLDIIYGNDYLLLTPYVLDSPEINETDITITLSLEKFQNIPIQILNCSEGYELKPAALVSVANIYACQPISKFSLILTLSILLPVSVIVFLLGILVTILVMKGIVNIQKRLHLLKEKERAEQSVEKRIIEKKIIFGDSYMPLIDKRQDSEENELSQRFLIPISDITIEKKIAEGGQGVVYLGKWKNTKVAIKSLKSDQSEGFESEVSLLASLRHPCVLTLYGFSITSENKYMITEYLEGGSLEKLIYQSKTKVKSISFLEKINILQDTANGMSYLHALTPPIIHRDLKPANILLDKNNRCKIGDFGLSLLLSQSNATMTKNIGTFLYMSPETIQSNETSVTSSKINSEKSQRAPKVDIFSFAIIMWELFFEVSPYSCSDKVKYSKDHSIVDVISKVIRGERPTIPFESESELEEWLLLYPVHGGKSKHGTVQSILKYCQIIRQCWHPDPMERPSFYDIFLLLNEISNTFQGN